MSDFRQQPLVMVVEQMAHITDDIMRQVQKAFPNTHFNNPPSMYDTARNCLSIMEGGVLYLTSQESIVIRELRKKLYPDEEWIVPIPGIANRRNGITGDREWALGLINRYELPDGLHSHANITVTIRNRRAVDATVHNGIYSASFFYGNNWILTRGQWSRVVRHITAGYRARPDSHTTHIPAIVRTAKRLGVSYAEVSEIVTNRDNTQVYSCTTAEIMRGKTSVRPERINHVINEILRIGKEHATECTETY